MSFDSINAGAAGRLVPVELAKAYRLLNHGPVTLVTSAHAGRRNVMAASWAMPLDFQPPKVAVVIDSRTLTRELVEASGEFALNIPARVQAAATLESGSRSGREQDKFAAAGLTTFAAKEIAAPLGRMPWLAGMPGNPRAGQRRAPRSVHCRSGGCVGRLRRFFKW